MIWGFTWLAERDMRLRNRIISELEIENDHAYLTTTETLVYPAKGTIIFHTKYSLVKISEIKLGHQVQKLPKPIWKISYMESDW